MSSQGAEEHIGIRMSTDPDEAHETLRTRLLDYRRCAIRTEHSLDLCEIIKVMDLEQVHVVRAEPSERTLELPPGAIPITLLNFGSQEHPVTRVRRDRTVVQLRVLVEGCRIEVVHPKFQRTVDDPNSCIRASIER